MDSHTAARTAGADADAGVDGANGAEKRAPFPSHPLGPLSADEIARSSHLIAQEWPQGTSLLFKVVKLREPAKKELVPYLEAERAGGELAPIDRRSDVLYYIKNTVCFATGAPCMHSIILKLFTG